MATQVNKKIVAGIVVGIVGLCLAVVAAGVYVTQKSPTKNIARGDAAYAAGDYELAADQYSRAVNKDNTNIEYIDKWASALLQVLPDNDADYRAAYNRYVTQVLESKSRQRPGTGEFQLEFVEEWVRRARSGGALGAESLDAVINEIEPRAEGLREGDEYRTRVLRWRGWALASKSELTALTDDEYEQAKNDLTSAYELDADPGVLVDLHTLHTGVERFALADRRMDVAQSAGAAADEAMSLMTSEHAGHPRVIAARLLVTGRELASEGAEGYEERIEGAAREAAEAFSRIDVSEHDSGTLVRSASTLLRVVPREASGLVDSVIERKLEEEPANSRLMMLRAQIALANNEPDRAFGLFQEVVDTPNQPISIEGFRLLRDRRIAIYNQGLLRVKQAEFASGEEKEPFLAEAEELLETLRERVLTSEETLAQKLSAQITLQRALVADDGVEKNRLLKDALAQLRALEDANPNFSDDPDVLLGYVLALLEQNLPGAAREKLERLSEVRGSETAQTLLYWAVVEQQLNNLESSVAYYTRLLEMMPDNEFARANRSRLLAAMATEGEEIVGDDERDPLLMMLNRARDLRAEGDLEGAVGVLEELLTRAPNDPAVLRFLVSLDLTMDNRDRAIERLRAAIDARPDNQALRDLLTQVEIEDPYEAQLQIIADSDDPEAIKALRRESVFRGALRNDDAEAELARAIELAPDDPQVIQRQFVRAIARGQEGLPEAQEAVEKASRIDLDGHGGDVFRARLLSVRGEAEEAIEILTGITESNPFDADAWRWLGAAQRSAGLIDAAVESYARAYTARPRDVGYAGDYANALVAAGRGVEAAAVLSPDTGLLSTGTGGEQTVERWLRLEGQFGDRQRVLEMRDQSFQRDPAAIINTLSYLQMLIEDGSFERAQEVVDGYAATDNPRPLRIAQMTATLRAEEGELEEAARVINEFIEATPEDERTGDPFRILARLYEQAGDIASAAETFRRGREYQDERLLLDRSLADLRFRSASNVRGNTLRMNEQDPNRAPMVELYQAGYREAKEVYEQVVESTGFDELILKRIAECQLHLNEYDALDETLNELVAETGEENDLQVLLIRAVAAEQRGDRESLDRFLNRAVEFNSQNPIAYFRRAQVNMAIPERRPDVIADLEEAVKLRPGYVEAWGLLAQAYALNGETDQAFQKLRGAIASNPNDERLPRVLVDLYVAVGSLDNALDEATRYATADEEDIYWIDRVARLAQRTNNFDTAYRWLTLYDEQTEFTEDSIALDRLNALLRRDSGVEVPEVNRLMRRIDDMEMEGDSAIVVDLLKARAEAARGNMRRSDQLIISVHERARERGPGALNLVINNLYLRALQTMPPERAQVAALEFLRDRPEVQPPHPYVKLELLRPSVFGATTRDQREQVNAALEAVASEIDPEDNVTRLRYLQLASNLRYALEDYAGSVEASEAALAISPNDPQMANNLAYTLSTHLGRHEDGLTWAERAAAVQPNASYVLDTLGVIQLRVGDVDSALGTLDRAIITAASPDNLFAALLHKAEALLAADRASEARNTAIQAQSAMNNSSQQTRELYEDDLQRLIDRLP